MVVEASQAEKAGLQRGDIICYAGSEGVSTRCSCVTVCSSVYVDRSTCPTYFRIEFFTFYYPLFSLSTSAFEKRNWK